MLGLWCIIPGNLISMITIFITFATNIINKHASWGEEGQATLSSVGDCSWLCDWGSESQIIKLLIIKLLSSRNNNKGSPFPKLLCPNPPVIWQGRLRLGIRLKL